MKTYTTYLIFHIKKLTRFNGQRNNQVIVKVIGE